MELATMQKYLKVYLCKEGSFHAIQGIENAVSETFFAGHEFTKEDKFYVTKCKGLGDFADWILSKTIGNEREICLMLFSPDRKELQFSKTNQVWGVHSNTS